MDLIETKIIKGKIIATLKIHLLESISIKEFRKMTDLLNLDDINLKLRDLIIKEAIEKVKEIAFNDEWEFFEMMEEP